MYIKELHVKNFRNHRDTRVKLDPGLNIFVGNNAAGKTNLVEAIFLACVGRGWRTNRDRDMIMFDEDLASVRVTATKRYGDVSVGVDLRKIGKKAIQVNGIPVQKMGELMGQINCVFFSPDELRLVKEAPADRRRFMDIDLSQIDKSYFYNLMRYNKVLAQRNALLKSGTTEDIDRGLDVWDIELVRLGNLIIKGRVKLLEELREKVEKIHGFLSGETEHVEISYEGITDDLAQAVAQAREKDKRLRTTTVGPHRDDICILIDGKDVRKFASQGQQRTVALAIKLAEIEVFEQATGEKPVLLLDDVFSELDDARQNRLLQAVKSIQAIVTTTDSPIINIQFFYIKNGSLDVPRGTSSPD